MTKSPSVLSAPIMSVWHHLISLSFLTSLWATEGGSRTKIFLVFLFFLGLGLDIKATLQRHEDVIRVLNMELRRYAQREQDEMHKRLNNDF